MICILCFGLGNRNWTIAQDFTGLIEIFDGGRRQLYDFLLQEKNVSCIEEGQDGSQIFTGRDCY